MEIIRYDGTRLMTVDDVDRDFLGHVVLLDTEGFGSSWQGYLLASVEGGREAFKLLHELRMTEYGGKGSIESGCDKRGMTIGVFCQDT